MADWSRLPSELVREIANQLGAVEDFVAFLMVCSSWRSAAPKQEWNPRVPQLPWLILAESNGSESETTTRGFYNLGRNKRYDLNVPETHGRRCWGSEIGWMFTVGMDLQTHLFNPLSHVQISLPPLTTFEKHPYTFDFEEEKPPYPDWIRTRFVRRACVINGNRSAPFVTANNIVVMAIYGDNSYLALAKPGYESWVSLQDDGNARFHDIVCFKDQIFGIRLDGTLVLCEIEGPDPPKTSDFALPHEEVDGWESIYLVESAAGELLMVLRLNLMVEDYEQCYKTDGFDVYKFDFSTRKWTELLDLGDQTLFLGANYSMSFTASDLNCKANSIYFADDNWFFWHKWEGGGGHDMGICNMEAMTSEPFYLGDDSRSHFSPPTWVMPRLA
uniref:F-box domain-containing protein n=1 Tax=Davidia involucrata TaxID=16924 RepID=A0A5B6ZKT9_DAVIN